MTPKVIPVISFRLRSPVHIGLQGGRAGDVRRDARRGRDAGDDGLGGLDGFVGQRFALVAVQVDLYVGGLAVVALRAGRGQRVAPEILNVLNVFGVGE